MGNVEHDALQEEDEGDPLVVGVLHGLALALDPGLNSLIGVLVTLASCIPAWKDKKEQLLNRLELTLVSGVLLKS